MSDELQALRNDLTGCENEVTEINAKFAELAPKKNEALTLANELGKQMKALSESTRVPIARAEGLRSQIATLENQPSTVES